MTNTHKIYIDSNNVHYSLTEEQAEEFTGLTEVTIPKPDDGKDYLFNPEKDGWEEIIEENPTTAELMERMSGVLGVSQQELTGIINGLIAQYTPQLPAPTREDIFTSANNPDTPDDYATMKPLEQFEYLGFYWNSHIDGNRQEERFISTRAFLALPTVPIGHWTSNPVSSITKNQGTNSFCVCPSGSKDKPIRISRIDGYFLQSIWGYK